MPTETVQMLFERTAQAAPDRVAVHWSGGRSLTYSELRHRARCLAGALIRAGAGRGSLVGILSNDPIETIAATLATLYVGGAFVPLDSTVPIPRLRAMLKVAAPEVFLAERRYCGIITQCLSDRSTARVVLLDRSTTTTLEAPQPRLILEEPCEKNNAEPLAMDGDDICYVYFTSGSTGEPKAIAGRTKSVAHFCNWEARTFAAGAGTNVSQLTRPSYDAYLRDVFTPLTSGGTICTPPSRDVISRPDELVQWIDREGITILHTVPSVFRALVSQELTGLRFAALRCVLLAGEALLPADVRRWFQIFGERIRLINLYGPSETTMTKFWYEVKPADAERHTIPIGKPMEGARALVCDSQGQPCGVGAVGEVYIRTPFRSLGYFKRPDLTQAVFIKNPSGKDPNDLLYKTGDLARILEDGNFEFLGRRDRQVKIRGIRVELAEVENALREHDSVRDLAVVDLDEPGGGKYLCAYIVLHPVVPVSELREFLCERLPEAIVPGVYIPMETLPRTGSGKIDRSALPLTASPAGKGDDSYVAPQTPTEEALAAIWSELMQIASPGIHYNFFTVGGHSLLAMQVISRVEGAFGVSMPLQTFLTGPTIHELAQYIEAAILELDPGADELLDLLDAAEEAGLSMPAIQSRQSGSTEGAS